MGRLARSRVKRLERRTNVHGPPISRLLFLLPDLWEEQDRVAFEDPDGSLEELGDLVERRTGVAPTFGMAPVWAITVPVSVGDAGDERRREGGVPGAARDAAVAARPVGLEKQCD